MAGKTKSAEWLTRDGLLYIQMWATEGLTDEEIAKKIGIATSTLYEWKKRYQTIAEAIKKGKAPADFLVEQSLYKRALGYEYDQVKIEEDEQGRRKRTVTTHHLPPDTASAFIWLKNRRPDRWRDNPKQTNEDNEALEKILKEVIELE